MSVVEEQDESREPQECTRSVEYESEQHVRQEIDEDATTCRTCNSTINELPISAPLEQIQPPSGFSSSCVSLPTSFSFYPIGSSGSFKIPLQEKIQPYPSDGIVNSPLEDIIQQPASEMLAEFSNNSSYPRNHNDLCRVGDPSLFSSFDPGGLPGGEGVPPPLHDHPKISSLSSYPSTSSYFHPDNLDYDTKEASSASPYDENVEYYYSSAKNSSTSGLPPTKRGSQGGFKMTSGSFVSQLPSLITSTIISKTSSVPGALSQLPAQLVGHYSGISSQLMRQKSPFGPPNHDTVFALSFAFNQDASCFICSTSCGFRVYTTSPLHEFARRETTAFPSSPLSTTSPPPGPSGWTGGGCGVAAMLFRTNLFALVPSAAPSKVILWDDCMGKKLGELRARENVIAVKLSREIVAVVTNYLVYIFKINNSMKAICVFHTGTNPFGLCEIANVTTSPSCWRIACPSITPGVVRVQTLCTTTVEGAGNSSLAFQAHNGTLAGLALNQEGSLMATASAAGTVIRIFQVGDGTLLHELRRGTHCHRISCMTFRQDNNFLAVASSSSTVHIFQLIPSDFSVDHPHAVLSSVISYPLQRHAATSDGTFTTDTSPSHRGGVGASPPRPSPSSDPQNPSPSSPPPLTNGAVPAVVQDAYHQGRVVVQDVLKGVFPQYFGAERSFAQFHIPADHLSLDVRAIMCPPEDTEEEEALFHPKNPTTSSFPPQQQIDSVTSSLAGCSTVGVQVAFAGARSNHIFIVHTNGVFYECRFDAVDGGECTVLSATTWFATRQDFRIQPCVGVPSALPSELEGGHEGDDWQLIL